MNFKPGSPQLTPLSNVNHPAYKPTSPVPSSPLRDSIPAVRERISTLFRSGKAAQLLQNASRSAPVSASYKKNFHPAKASGTPFGPSTGHYSPYSPLTPAHGSPSPASVSWNGMQSGKSQGQQANANSASASLYIMELYAKKRKLMLEIQVKDIIIGFVSQKSSKGITIHCTKCWKSDGMLINIDPFNIDAVCPLSELSTDIEQEEDVFIEKEELVKSNRDQFDLLDCFSIGTVVKAVLTSIDPHLDVVECSMKAETLRQSSLNRFISKLGICSNEEEDQIKQQALALTWASVSSSTAEKPSFNETRSQNSISVKSLVLEELESHPLFLNPSGLQLILKTLKIDEFGSLLPLQKSSTISYLDLRKSQNHQWVIQVVTQAKAHAAREEFSEALELYSHANEVDGSYLEIHLGKAEIFEKQNEYEQSRQCYLKILSIDPDHAYANEKLSALNSSLESQESLSSSLNSESSSYTDDNS